jgi:hypothetical protein
VPGTRLLKRWTPVTSALFVVVTLVPSPRAAERQLKMELPTYSAERSAQGELATDRNVALPSRKRTTGMRALQNTEPGFIKNYLLPRLSSQFDGLAPRHPIVDGPHVRVDHLMYDNLTDAARRGAERGARDALKNFLIDTTSVGKLFGRQKRNRSSALEDPTDARTAPTVQAPSRSTSDFGIGFSGGHPEVEWRYKAGSHSLRLRVNSEGAARLAFSRLKLNHTNLSVGYRPHSEQFALFLSHKF